MPPYPNGANGAPAPGLEPTGASIMNVDVDVKDGGVASFSYKLKTWDAGYGIGMTSLCKLPMAQSAWLTTSESRATIMAHTLKAQKFRCPLNSPHTEINTLLLSFLSSKTGGETRLPAMYLASDCGRVRFRH